MTRIRLVTEQDGVQHVSGEILAVSELWDALAVEETLHRLSGWHVDRWGETIRAAKGETVRWIWPRTREAMEDTL
jgi:hypothetical protein